MADQPERHRAKRVSLAELIARLEEQHAEQDELLVQTLDEIRRLRACFKKVKSKRNGTTQKGLC